MSKHEDPDPFRTRTDMSAQFLHVLDKLATAFDQAWQKGEQPRIEAYLNESPQAVRAELFQSLLRIELSSRARHGKSLPAGEYLARFPDYAKLINAVYEETVRPSKSSTDVQPEAWYYLRNNARVGPFTFEQLKQIVRAGDLRPKDRVAPGSMADWSEAGSIPDLFPRPGESGGLKAPASGDGIKNDYILLDRVGRGGMGDVFKAYRFSLKQEVALKIVRHDRFVRLSPAKQNEVLEAFRTEMQATANLQHENIISIFDNGDHNGLPFYTMNFVEKSLANILHHGPLQGQKAAEYIHKIARAVDFANDKGIVHRDIKPANILLDKQKCLLSDLGLATTEDLLDPQGKGQVAGTPPFMAPEQVRGDKPDRRTDVYGLGATLYCLLTGKPPHQGKDWEQIRQQVENAEPVPPRKLNPAVDRNLEAITLKCLEKDPEKRYASAAALAEDLERYLNDRPVLAKIPYVWERLYRWARREPIKAGLVGFIFLLIFLLFLRESWNNWSLSAALEVTKEAKTTAENARAAADLERAHADMERDKARAKEAEAKRSADEARQAKDKLALEQKKSLEMYTMFAMRALNKFKQQETTDKSIEDLVKYIDASKVLLKKTELNDNIKLDLAESHRSLALLYLQKNQPREAAQQYEECTRLQKELSEKKEFQFILLELGLNYMELGTTYGQLLMNDPELDADLKALDSLKKFEAQGKNNSVYLAALAEVNTMLGIDYRKGGRQKDSLEHQKDAIEILEQLNRHEKENVTFSSFQKQLAKAYQEIGFTLLSASNPTDAQRYLEKAKTLFTARRGQFRRELANVNKNLASALVQLKKHADAFDPLDDAAKIVTELLDESPDKKQLDQLRLLKAEIFSVEAKAHQGNGDTDKAKTRFSDSLSIRTDLADRDPKTYDPSLVNGLVETALFFEKEKQYQDAIDYLDKAVPIQERLILRYPGVPNYVSTMGLIWFQKALACNRLKKDSDALTYIKKAKSYDIQAYDLSKKKGEVFEGYLYPTFLSLYTIQMNLGLTKDAADTLEERMSYWPKDGARYAEAASDFAKIYKRDMSDDFAGRLAAFLDKGLQNKALRIANLNDDPDLAAFRTHPEYRKLSQKYQP